MEHTGTFWSFGVCFFVVITEGESRAQLKKAFHTESLLMFYLPGAYDTQYLKSSWGRQSLSPFEMSLRGVS